MKLFEKWFPSARPVSRSQGPHSKLVVALIADDLTRTCFEHECTVLNVTPRNYEAVFRAHRPDFLFVESAWAGWRDQWKYRIASYPEHPERNNAALAQVVQRARDLGVPAVFWNKEDGVHFERFIDSARLFDYVFTVDQRCVERYRTEIAREVFVAPMMFAFQPAFHRFTGFEGRAARACFVGSYSRHIHDARRDRQHMLLETAARSLGVTIFDRNSDRRSENYRYPELGNMQVRGKVPYERTSDVYKSHLVSLNVNTIEDSATMFSRRLIEIIACGGLAVSTPALAIDTWFRDYCHVVSDAGETSELLQRLKADGYSPRDREMMAAGAAYVLAHHTYADRIETILDAVGRRPS